MGQAKNSFQKHFRHSIECPVCLKQVEYVTNGTDRYTLHNAIIKDKINIYCKNCGRQTAVVQQF